MLRCTPEIDCHAAVNAVNERCDCGQRTDHQVRYIFQQILPNLLNLSSAHGLTVYRFKGLVDVQLVALHEAFC